MYERLYQSVCNYLIGWDICDSILHSAISSQIYWCLISIYLVRAWNTRLCARAIDPWLSPLKEMKYLPVAFSLSLPQQYSIVQLLQPLTWAILILECCWSKSRRLCSIRSNLSQVAYFAANVKVMYSALLEDNAIVACLFEHQLTGPLFSMKIYLNVNFGLFLSSAQSESEQPLIRSFLSPYT